MNIYNKRNVVLMNMKIAFMEAVPNFNWKDGDRYSDSEKCLDINFGKRLSTLTESQINDLYREICDGSELVYLRDQKVFALGNKVDYQTPINEVSEYSLS